MFSIAGAREDLQQLSADHAGDFLFIIDHTLGIDYLNIPAFKPLGHLNEDIINQPFEGFSPSTLCKLLYPGIRRIRPMLGFCGASVPDETLVLPAEDLWLDTRLTPLRNKNGKVMAVLGLKFWGFSSWMQVGWSATRQYTV